MTNVKQDQVPVIGNVPNVMYDNMSQRMQQTGCSRSGRYRNNERHLFLGCSNHPNSGPDQGALLDADFPSHGRDQDVSIRDRDAISTSERHRQQRTRELRGVGDGQRNGSMPGEQQVNTGDDVSSEVSTHSEFSDSVSEVVFCQHERDKDVR